MVLEKSNRDGEYNLHVTGKYLPEETHNLVRDGVEFQFDGLAEVATQRIYTAQNQIYQFIRQKNSLLYFTTNYENPNTHWGSVAIRVFPNIKKQKIPC